MRHLTLLTQSLILLMVVVVVSPDLFHHVPMPVSHITESDTANHESTSPHDPVACSIAHAGHGCHVVMQPQSLASNQSDVPTASLHPFNSTLRVAVLAADIFHPPQI